MSRTFYPSDEYDSEELERTTKGGRQPKGWRTWNRRANDDDGDDNPPTAPVIVWPPHVPGLGDGATVAA